MGDIANIFTRPYEQAKADEAIARDYLALKAKGELTEEERALVAIYELRGALTPETAAQQLEDALRRQALSQADYDAWKEGSLNKTLLHGFVGALQASFGGADALSGALGAGAAEASRNLTEQLPKELQQWASAAVGAAAGAMAGGGSAGVQTGAATAWSGEVYNRQLHISEHQLIRNKAREIAQESPPEHRADVEQYWYLLLVGEAQAMVDAQFAVRREADVSYLGVLAADPTREAYFYFDDYVADRARARQFLLSMQGQPILDTSGQPIVAQGGALVTFAATNDRQFQDHSLFAPGTPPWQQWQQFRDGPSVPELSGYTDSQIANVGANRSVELAAQSRSERYATTSGAVDSTFPELDLLLAGGLKAPTGGLSVAKRINEAILALGKGPLSPQVAARGADDLVTVRTYTNTVGREGISNSGHLRADTWVTLPDQIPSRAGHLQIERILEIQPGRGSHFLELQVPRSNLRIPANGPRTSGDALQFQLNNPVPIDPSTFRRPPGRQEVEYGSEMPKLRSSNDNFTGKAISCRI